MDLLAGLDVPATPPPVWSLPCLVLSLLWRLRDSEEAEAERSSGSDRESLDMSAVAAATAEAAELSLVTEGRMQAESRVTSALHL